VTIGECCCCTPPASASWAPGCWRSQVAGPGAAAGHHHLPDRRVVRYRGPWPRRPDAGRARDRPGRGPEQPDRGMRAAAPGPVRHPGRRDGGRARPHARGRRRGPDHGLGHNPAARLRRQAFRPSGKRPGWSEPLSRPWGPCWWSTRSRPRTAWAGRRPTVVLTRARLRCWILIRLAAVPRTKGSPGWPPPPPAGPGEDRAPGASVPASDAGRGGRGDTALVELHADDAARRPAAQVPWPPALVCWPRRQPGRRLSRGRHRHAARIQPPAGPGAAAGRGHRHLAAAAAAASRWPRCSWRLPRPCWPRAGACPRGLDKRRTTPIRG